VILSIDGQQTKMRTSRSSRSQRQGRCSGLACRSRHASGAPRTGRAELRSSACSSGHRRRPFELQDKSVVRFALTIYPYSLGVIDF